MALPPRGDPRRPLHLAVSSCRVLGVLALLSGTCMGTVLIGVGASARNGNAAAMAVGAVIMFALLGGVGIAYLVLASQIKRHKSWAVVAALSITGVLALFMLLSVFVQGASVIVLLVSNTGGTPSPVTVSTLGPLVFSALILAAVGQLIYHLSLSFAAIRLAPPVEARGFDVLPMAVLPTQPPTTEATDGPVA